MARARGLDVSQVQGAIQWDAVKAAGFDWVVVKCTEGAHYTDPAFKANVLGARAAGLLVGTYHFITESAPIADQAVAYLKAMDGVLVDLPPCIDFEYPPPEKWTDKGARLPPRALEMARTVRDAGYAPIIYTYPYFGDALPWTPELTELVEEFPLWIASYHDEKHEPKDSDSPTLPKPWHARRWTFWQHSGDRGLAVPGIAGVVDHDVYDGTIDELRAWLGSMDNPYAANEVGTSDTLEGPAA